MRNKFIALPAVAAAIIAGTTAPSIAATPAPQGPVPKGPTPNCLDDMLYNSRILRGHYEFPATIPLKQNGKVFNLPVILRYNGGAGVLQVTGELRRDPHAKGPQPEATIGPVRIVRDGKVIAVGTDQVTNVAANYKYTKCDFPLTNDKAQKRDLIELPVSYNGHLLGTLVTDLTKLRAFPVHPGKNTASYTQDAPDFGASIGLV